MSSANWAALTPGPYFHVGGDESHVTKKEDYIPFIEQVQEIVQANGKQMIGWDETTPVCTETHLGRPILV